MPRGDAAISFLFVLLAIALWQAGAFLVRNVVLQLAGLFVVGVVTPILVNGWRRSTDRPSARTLLVGQQDSERSAPLAAALALFVGVFSITYVWTAPVLELVGRTYPAPLLLGVGIASVVTYVTRGVLPAILVATLPAVALSIHFLHGGTTPSMSYLRAVPIGVALGFAVGVPLGLFGATVGFGGRRLAAFLRAS